MNIVKRSRFSVGRALSDEEWLDLKAWKAENPSLSWSRGDICRDTGKTFLAWNKRCKNGEHWGEESALLRNREAGRKSMERARRENPEKYRAIDRERYKTDPSRKEYPARWYAENKELAAETQRRWVAANIEKVREYHRGYCRDRRKADPKFAMRLRVRDRITTALKRRGYDKGSPTADMIGCDWDVFSKYIESQFVDGMGWHNRNEWHLDHIVPLASSSTVSEMEKLCHYTNLQPLWATDNMRKGAKLHSI